MSRLSLQLRVTKALVSAGASEEILALVNLCFERCLTPQDTGRPRQYANRTEQQRAYRERKRREKALAASSPGSEAPLSPEKLESKKFWQQEYARVVPVSRTEFLKSCLQEAAQGNFDADADVAPIQALLDQGCDLVDDVLLIVAREVPDLAQPLRSWGVKWLADQILSARDRRLGALGAPSEAPKANEAATPDDPSPLPRVGGAFEDAVEAASSAVEAPPPARRMSAFDWDEFVAGHRAGLIEWNTARLSPGRGGQGSARRRRELDLPLSRIVEARENILAEIGRAHV